MENYNTSTTSISSDGMWGNPEFIKFIDTGESLELIYKQASLITNYSTLISSSNYRVFKIVYSCVDGQWNKSEPIYGEIVLASEEHYLFED